MTQLSAINANIGLVTAGKIYSTSGNTKIDLDNGTITFNNGVIMMAEGVGFGFSNQFLEWAGPSKASLSQCTEADAIRYLKVDGSAYFGGTLNAGVITNAVRTTLTFSTADVSTGAFTSNGRTRNVNVSYQFETHVSNTNVCPSSPVTPSVTIELYRGVDASGTFLTSRTFTGSYSCSRGPVSDPGSIDESISGSFAYQDTSGGTSVSYYTRISVRSSNTAPTVQTLGLISVEQ